MRLLPPAGPQRRRQIVVLCVALPAALGLLWYELRPAPAPATAKPPASNTQTRAGAQTQMKLPDPVKLGSLEPVPDEPTEGRNLFRFGEHPPPPRPPQPAYVPPPQPVGPPPPPPGPPPIPIKATGRYSMPDGKIMVQLRDPQSGATFIAGEGQIVDGRYRVLKIGLESVVMAYLDGTGQRTLEIGR